MTTSVFPNLTGEIAKRGIKKSTIAKSLGISYHSFYNKLYGQSSFTWEEVNKVNNQFFPDMDLNSLFARAEPSPTVQSGKEV